MGFQIEGDLYTADVTGKGQLKVRAISSENEAAISREEQRSFNVVFSGPTMTDGQYVAYIKNTSTTRNMHIWLTRCGAEGTAPIIWKIHSVTGTAANGVAVTPINLNLSSGLTAEATTIGDQGGTAISGLTSEGVVAQFRHANQASFDVPFHGTLILGPGNAIAVEADDGSVTASEVLIRFYYEDIV